MTRPMAGVPHSALNDEPVTHERLRDCAGSSTATPASGSWSARSTCSRRPRWPPTTGTGTSSTWPSTSRPLYARGGTAVERVHRPDRRRPWMPEDAWPTWVLSNHDNPRPPDPLRPGGGRPGRDAAPPSRRSEARARAAAVLLLTLRGTPFLYQGEELGLEDAVIPADARSTPEAATAAGRRCPGTGPTTTGGRPIGGGPAMVAVPARGRPAEPPTTCATTRGPSCISTAGSSPCDTGPPALSVGAFELLDLPEGLVGFRRIHRRR